MFPTDLVWSVTIMEGTVNYVKSLAAQGPLEHVMVYPLQKQFNGDMVNCRSCSHVWTMNYVSKLVSTQGCAN